MQRSKENSAAMREVEAYAHQEYQDHLKAIQQAPEIEEALRWKMATAQAAIDVWRSMESSTRGMVRGAA
jgi:hypothetical protein